MSRYLPLSSKSRNNVSSAVRLTKLGRLFVILIFLLSLVVGSVTSAAAATITFTGTELLGRPTDTSISVSIVPNAAISLYYQYGTTSGGPYTAQTATTTASAGQPKVVTISGLTPNTKYYYRMQYSTDSGASWTIGLRNPSGPNGLRAAPSPSQSPPTRMWVSSLGTRPTGPAR